VTCRVAGASEAALQDKLAAQATLAASLQGQLDAANAQLAREREHGGQQQTTAAGAIAASHAARDAAKHLAEQRLAQVRHPGGCRWASLLALQHLRIAFCLC